ncbi:MAG: aspartate-semialdehyde dehydrogenase [Mogibacterium sp.]|nr:aspartate-semialdehyde dehydrogenase [Mogibacterium sp.]
MKKYNVGILGATGAVGMEMIKVLAERSFPIGELRLLASSRSAGKQIETPFGTCTVVEAADSAFGGLDIVLGASANAISKQFAPAIKASGAVYVDNSSAFRMDPDVPLIVPEVNPEDAKLHHGIIANPNCSTIITVVGINAIRRLSKIKAIYASTYQAVSGAGIKGPQEMYTQTRNILSGEPIEASTFAHQIAFNLIPMIGSAGDNLYTSEEMKMQNEGRKIMHLPELKVSCTCVRVPVERSHSISACVITEDHLDLDVVREAVAREKGCQLVDDPNAQVYPMPLETSNQDDVFVGRIRRDLVNENGINLWCCGDQVRKGAATNAVQIAELLIER